MTNLILHKTAITFSDIIHLGFNEVFVYEGLVLDMIPFYFYILLSDPFKCQSHKSACLLYCALWVNIV